MRISVIVALSVFASAKVLWSQESKSSDTIAADLKSMQGTWVAVRIVENGKVMSKEDLAKKPQQITIRDRILEAGSRGRVNTRFKITLDPSKSPKWIDLDECDKDGKTEEGAKARPGTYSIRDSKLVISLHDKDSSRAKSFDENDTKEFVVAEFALQKK